MSRIEERTFKEHSWHTALGLTIALLGIGGVSFVFNLLVQTRTNSSVLLREGVMFILLAILLWCVRNERLPLPAFDKNIRSGLAKSMLIGFGTSLILILITLSILMLLPVIGLEFDSQSGNKQPLSLFVTGIVIIRAAVVEEVFYRWYATDRLGRITGKPVPAALVSLIFFAGFHYTQGAAGMILAFSMGAVLTLVYSKTRNLLALIIAHFLIDFIPNILIPMLS